MKFIFFTTSCWALGVSEHNRMCLSILALRFGMLFFLRAKIVPATCLTSIEVVKYQRTITGTLLLGAYFFEISLYSAWVPSFSHPEAASLS